HHAAHDQRQGVAQEYAFYVPLVLPECRPGLFRVRDGTNKQCFQLVDINQATRFGFCVHCIPLCFECVRYCLFRRADPAKEPERYGKRTPIEISSCPSCELVLMSVSAQTAAGLLHPPLPGCRHRWDG